MMKKVNVIGMDLGDKYNKAVVLAEDGEIVDRAEVPCTQEGVRAYLERHPGALLVIETGTHCRWVSRIGSELGHEVLVGNARKLRMIWNRSRKNDWNDAEMLARVARTDRKLFSPVRLRGDGDQGLMRLVKSRDLLVRDRTGIVNEIRGFCKAEGARLPKRSTEAFARMEYEVPASVRTVAKPLFAVLRELTKKIALYDQMISDATRKLYNAEVELLDTIGGVGPVTTAAFLAAVGDPATFGSARDAGPYFGLVPKQNQSGQTDRQMRITKEGNAVVRRLLVTAANYIMGPFGKDSDLRRHGMQIAERGGKNARKRAKVAVARKLAVLMLAILKNRSAYRPLKNVEVAA
jgi:transposase